MASSEASVMTMKKLSYIKTLGDGGFGQVAKFLCTDGDYKGQFFAVKRQTKGKNERSRIDREKDVSSYQQIYFHIFQLIK